MSSNAAEPIRMWRCCRTIKSMCRREPLIGKYAGIHTSSKSFHFLVGRFHHAATPLQVAFAPTLVDPGFDSLPRIVCRGVPDLSDAAPISVHQQNDDGRQGEYSAGRYL